MCLPVLAGSPTAFRSFSNPPPPPEFDPFLKSVLSSSFSKCPLVPRPFPRPHMERVAYGVDPLQGQSPDPANNWVSLFRLGKDHFGNLRRSLGVGSFRTLVRYFPWAFSWWCKTVPCSVGSFHLQLCLKYETIECYIFLLNMLLLKASR